MVNDGECVWPEETEREELDLVYADHQPAITPHDTLSLYSSNRPITAAVSTADLSQVPTSHLLSLVVLSCLVLAVSYISDAVNSCRHFIIARLAENDLPLALSSVGFFYFTFKLLTLLFLSSALSIILLPRSST